MADKVSKFIFPVKTGNTVNNKEFDVGGGNTFVGTTAEWNALTTEQQNAYDCRVLTDDDLDTKSVIDNLTSDSTTDALSAKQGKVLKGLVDTTQGQVSDSGDAYDPTKAYAVGELCIYNNKLYRCTTACSAGSWATNQSCFTADTLTNVTGVIAKSLNRETIACGNATLEVYGNVCILQMNNANMPAEQSNFIPQGYRPHFQVWGAVSRVPASSSFISEARVSIYPDGKVSTQVNGNNVSVQIRGQLSWII